MPSALDGPTTCSATATSSGPTHGTPGQLPRGSPSMPISPRSPSKSNGRAGGPVGTGSPLVSSSMSAYPHPSNPRRRAAPSPNGSSSPTSSSSHSSRPGIERRASKLPRVSSSSAGPSSASARFSSTSDSPHPPQPSAPLSAPPPTNPPPAHAPEQPTVSAASAAPAESSGVRVLPGSLADAELGDVLIMVGDMLTRLLEHNDRLPLSAQRGQSLTRFHSRAIPSITVRDYLVRIARYTPLEKVCVLLVLVYIDRIAAAQASQVPPVPSAPSTFNSHSTGEGPAPDVGVEGEPRGEGVEVEGEGPSWAAPLQPAEARFTLCSLTVHRFVCAAVVCSSKALCDSFATNAHYSRVGGISLEELNVLERELLRLTRWRLACSSELLEQYYRSLVTAHPAYALADDVAPPS